MKAFTFLGRGPLHKCNYIFDSQECETNFIAEAIVEFFSPESFYIFATDSAAREPVSKEITDERLNHITRLLSDKTKVKPITIKEGSDETELWDIFSSVVDNINDNDNVLFDITHGFRSLPFLTFLTLAYVSNVKSNVTIEKVIYGAYEAVERDNPNKPVFDLTPFVELLDWMNAVNVFQNYGDARPIASLNVDRKMKDTLNSLSNALLTNRTLEAQNAAMTFNGLPFDDTQQPPFQMLVNQLKQSYQSMAVNNPSDNPENSLKAQYQQIKWYMDNQHYLQAITLMREWLISWKCFKDRKKWLNAYERSNVEDDFNMFDENNPFATLDFEMKAATELWNGCKIRSDLAHCGMRNNPKEAEDAIGEIKDLFTNFKTFADTQVG